MTFNIRHIKLKKDDVVYGTVYQIVDECVFVDSINDMNRFKILVHRNNCIDYKKLKINDMMKLQILDLKINKNFCSYIAKEI